jgi:hypothetical protein
MPIFHEIIFKHIFFKWGKIDSFADTSAFNAGVKEKNTKTNKIIIAKNRKLATQTKSGKNPKCSFFMTKCAVEPKHE